MLTFNMSSWLALAEPLSELHHEVPLSVTLLFAGILAAMIAALALEEKIHAKKSVIAGFFALASLFVADALHLLPLGALVNVFGEEIRMPIYIPGIDWNVIAIILGSSLFVDVTSRSGLFTWIAMKLTKATGGDPLKLFWAYGILTVVFSALLNNVTAMIIVGSLTVVSLGKLKLNNKLLGFLLIEGLLTNIGGLLTLISSVPNIIIGDAAGISFLDFFLTSSPFVIVATAVTLYMGSKLIGISGLKSEDEKASAQHLVESFDETDGIDSPYFFYFAAAMTVLFIAVIATASVLPVIQDLGLGYIALGFGLIMLMRFKATADKFYSALDWDLLGFFAALFVVINVMEHAQVLALIGAGLQPVVELGSYLGGGLILTASAVFSSVTDNIPLAAILAKVLHDLGTASDSALWWSVVFGANLGGNITPIGSASTLVAVTIMHKHNLKLSFVGFIKMAIPYALVHIALATMYVLIFLT